MKNSIKEVITSEQCRAARAFLNWSQEDLAKKVRVIKTTIGDFERKKTVPYRKILKDIRPVFEVEGIEFKNEEGVLGLELIKKD